MKFRVNINPSGESATPDYALVTTEHAESNGVVPVLIRESDWRRMAWPPRIEVLPHSGGHNRDAGPDVISSMLRRVGYSPSVSFTDAAPGWWNLSVQNLFSVPTGQPN